MIIDTHCHLDFFLSPPPSHFFNSLKNKTYLEVDASFITMSTSSLDWLSQLELSQKFKHVYCALGIHPWYAQDIDVKKSLVQLENLFITEPITALGEVGLDFTSYYKKNKTLQLDLFIEQIFLAKRFDKPVSLHVRKAHNDMLDVLSSIAVQGVVHGLGASKELAQSYVDLGFKIGVNGIVTRENARRYHELVKYFGLKYLVLETDFPHVRIMHSNAPFLSDIILVAEKMASLLKCSVEEVLEKTTLNAQEIFNLNGTLDGK
ncbi:Putative deoxyribonuclease YjjV [hydrothermal vent metagenome]|uniref:Deoxyribonuclease YjjV n=1 Tax=hydrothermal vent metagenome TaxID=652676 RepID=A0A3B0VYI4_9ZZZZ